MIFLSSPYSHPDPAVVQRRYEEASAAVVALTKVYPGDPVFSVIAYGHPLVVRGLPNTFEFWDKLIRQTMAVCDRVIVLNTEGWTESEGVAKEIEIADILGKPIQVLTLAKIQALSCL
jgi:hypothetical protein